jgi:MFS family permease
MQGEPGYGGKTTHAIATANGLYSAGGAVGSLFVMWSATSLGRKLSIQIGAILAIIGGALQGGAAALAMFHVGRVISGLGIGILVTACPMYLSELAPPENRGWLVGHHAIFLVFGYMLSGWLGYACYFATSKNESFAWRFPLCVQTLPPLVLMVTSIWIPRSPRWLLQQGKIEEAWTVIRALRQSPDDPDDLVAKEELYQTKEQLALDAAKLKTIGYGPWMACIKKKSYRKRMIIGFLTQWGAEFAGPLVIVRAIILSRELLALDSVPPRILPRHTNILVIEQLLGHFIHQPRPNRLDASPPLGSLAHNGRYVIFSLNLLSVFPQLHSFFCFVSFTFRPINSVILPCSFVSVGA